MKDLGRNLGADVVPCFYRLVKAEGIGDIVTEIKSNAKYYIIIIKPEFRCSTKDMYSKIDNDINIEQKNNNKEMERALENNNIKEIAKNLYNVFEEVIEQKENLNKIKQELIQNGAEKALLTGSGSCIFGIFKNREKAKYAYKNLKEKYETYICTSFNKRKGK